ncbi:MAG: type II toxin-antitoxin system HipA family toxin YjjJ [Moraxellaceae bacterium]|nr:type II toxin-antitoxin system HipA family toxin YjjJ [Moraxellaceae bacterium]
MTSPNLDERLLQSLRRQTAPRTAKELATDLDVSQPTLSRALGRLGSQVAVLGQARSTRYALVRGIRDMGHRFPITRIGTDGTPECVGELIALAGEQFFVQWKAGNSKTFEDLPWFVWDMRPQGFLGRALLQQHPELSLPGRWQDWSSDDILQWLTLYGSSCPGDLIIGEAAFQGWLEREARHQPMAIALPDRTTAYPVLAANTLQGSGYGSSAGGEQPKFSALRMKGDSDYQEVLVKFSPPMDTAAGQRWADLLMCEHLALQLLTEEEADHGLATHSELIMAGGRAFLEVERFDRIGVAGRRGMVSLEAVNAEFLGLKEQTWEAAAAALLAGRQINKADHDALLRRTVFAQLIANTDRHFGNISFFMDDAGRLTLAPAYDMLPMAFAPVNNEVIERAFPTVRPRTDTLAYWARGQDLAERYWQRVQEDTRISNAFKQVVSTRLSK